MTVKQVIIVRKDLKMGKGKIGAQVAHASMKALIGSSVIQGSTLMTHLEDDAKEWLTKAFTKICLSCDSEEELLALHKEACDKGLLCCLICDNGTTAFHGVPTYTTCGIGPAAAEEIDKITGHLKLLN